VINSGTREVFEALEVKHNIQIDHRIVQDAANKIMDKTVDRYYILTTHHSCEPTEDVLALIDRIKSLYNCQVIVNGVLPSIKYYLRLISDPSLVFPEYVKLLASDSAIKHEHREAWNTLATMMPQSPS
jgi:DNA (cytosine-5)-methyltransferase 1